MKKLFRMLLATSMVVLLLTTMLSSVIIPQKVADAAEKKSIKILGIGNSFSQDGMYYIYQIAKDLGYDEVILGNLVIGGCSLEMHANNIKSNSKAYFYEKNTAGTWDLKLGMSIKDGLSDEDWDIISFQQVSGLSGVSETYNEDIDTIVNHINENKTNPDAKLYWHMTWAYEQSSTHQDFARYNKDQMTMYNAIVNAVQSKILTNPEIDGVIPSGTAIQNVRTSHIGDTLTRDGYHLSMDLGRFIAGVTWFSALTGESIDELSFAPNDDPYISLNLPLIIESVKAAIDEPFKVTESSFKTFEVDLSKYEKIDWKPVACSYWNSMAGPYRLAKHNSSALNLKYFVSSENMFTKDDLPVGSIIVVEPGYQYRADAWKSLKAQSTRPGFVNTKYTFVTEAWWDGYEYRAFNLSNTSVNLDVTDIADEVASKLSIYVPKSDSPKSNDNEIRGFAIGNVAGKITGDNIELKFANGTDLTSVVPDILFSIKANIDPALGAPIDLTSPVSYTVTAEDGSQRTYTVTAVLPSDETPDPDETPTPGETQDPDKTPADEDPTPGETPDDETPTPGDEPTPGQSPEPSEAPKDNEKTPTAPKTGDSFKAVLFVIVLTLSVPGIILGRKRYKGI